MIAIALLAMFQTAGAQTESQPVEAQTENQSAVAQAANQTAEVQTEKKKKLQFKPIAITMMSLYSEFPADSKARYGFNLDRTYLGVQATWGENWLFKFVTDCGKSSSVDDYHRIIYIKNALAQWKNSKFSVRVGMIGTNVFSTQEKIWGRRYVMKCFQDEYKFGSSADLGVAIEWSPVEQLSLDAIVVNGEGFKKVQMERGFLYGVGFTVKPFKNFLLRMYGDLNQSPDDGTPQKTLNAMVAYKDSKYSLAVEGNFVFDRDGTKAHNQSGLSTYGSVQVGRCDIFARYDLLTSKDNWNSSNDRSMVLAGVGIDLCKYVKIAPNVKVWIPKEGKATPCVNLNLQFSL